MSERQLLDSLVAALTELGQGVIVGDLSTQRYVSVNDAVEWVNKDPFPHNVTAKSGGFSSGNLPAAGKWQFRPRSRGTFEYVCTLHPGMDGTIVVTR